MKGKLFYLTLSPEDKVHFDTWSKKNSQLISQIETMSAGHARMLYEIYRWHADRLLETVQEKAELLKEETTAKEIYRNMIKEIKRQKSVIGKNAADALHDKPGGSRNKQQNIREIWATGKYTNRDLCAEEECAALGMSFSAARKALRNTPNPNA